MGSFSHEVWHKFYCPVCKKEVNHRSKEGTSIIRNCLTGQLQWECWNCKSKGRDTSIRRSIAQPTHNDEYNKKEWQGQMVNRLMEEAWSELVDEGLVRVEGDEKIWTYKGCVEIEKLMLKIAASISLREGLRPRKTESDNNDITRREQR